MDRDLIDDLLDTLLGEWPADERSGVREPCRLCEQAPVTDARITPDGPVHVYHTSPTCCRSLWSPSTGDGWRSCGWPGGRWRR